MAQTQLTKQASKEFIVDFNMNLIASGFTSAWMRELFPEDTENKFDRIFVMFERLGFSGKEAAVAIKEASTAFHRNKVDAEKNGWPLKYPASLTADFSRPEAYFIEQLAGTVMEMRQRMTQHVVG